MAISDSETGEVFILYCHTMITLFVYKMTAYCEQKAKAPFQTIEIYPTQRVGEHTL